jgi:hypothetical protein|tara:strand:- start:1813 stop:2478 length:666 start_codon:yes stop_codon:yes gene_type:complete
MNYSALVQAIKDYTEDTETTFVNQIDEFISQAELRILFDVDLPYFRKNSTGITTASNSYLGKPSDFLSAHSLALISTGNVYSYLLPKDVSFMREANPDTDDTGQPEYYGHFDDDAFILSPVPDDAYTMELHYKYKPTGLSSANTTTWLGDNLPQVLLYGCLVEAYTFMKGEQDIMQMYLLRYQEALVQAKTLGEYSDRRDGYRNGDPLFIPARAARAGRPA